MPKFIMEKTMKSGLFIFLIVLAVIVILIVYLSRRSKKGVKRTNDNTEVVDTGDDIEDILLTAVVLGDVLDDPKQEEMLDETDSYEGGFDGGGFDDGGGFE